MKQNNFDKQLAKLRRNKRILWLGILFFVAVVFWIGTSLFTAQKKITIPQELRDLAKPLIPRLESKVFDEIQEQRLFLEEELADFPIYILNDDSEKIILNSSLEEKLLSEEEESSAVREEFVVDDASSSVESSIN